MPVEGLLKEGGTFSPKNGMWKGKGLDLGAEPPRIPVQDFAEYPQQTPPPPPNPRKHANSPFFYEFVKNPQVGLPDMKWHLTYKNTKGIKIPTCREIDNKRTLSATQVLYCLCSTLFRLITFFILHKTIATSLDYKSKKSNEY